MGTDLEGLQANFSLAYTSFLRVMKHLDPDKRSQPGVSGHWSPKDVMSHLIGWDEALQEFIANPDEFNPDPLYNINTFNAKSVSKRQHLSWKEMMGELQSSYTNLQKEITSVTVEMKIYDRVREWLDGRKEDYEFHTNQMEEWIKRSGEASQ